MWRDPVTSEDELEELLGEPSALARRKLLGHLDAHCRDFIARSPFFVLATADAEGRCDASPRGGPPGFVRVLDERRLVWADYQGNHLADSSRNLLANPEAGLVFLLPGMGETLRVNGRATLTRDPDLLASLPTGGRAPELAVGFDVTAAYLHCAKAFRRSGLWDPATWPDELPSAARIYRDHAALPQAPEELEALLEQGYRTTLW